MKIYLLLLSLSPDVIPMSLAHSSLAKMRYLSLLDADVLASVAPAWAAAPQQQPSSGEGAGAGILGGPRLSATKVSKPQIHISLDLFSCCLF